MNEQKYVIKLDGFPNNQNELFTKSKGENVPLTRVSTTNISVTHNNTLPPSSHEQFHQPRQHQQQIKKRETITGNRTTHFQKSTHRVEYTDLQKDQNSDQLMPKFSTKDENDNYKQPSSSSSAAASIVTLSTNNNNNNVNKKKKNNNDNVRQILYRTERMSNNSLQFGNNNNNRSRIDPSERSLTKSLKKLKLSRNKNIKSEEAADVCSDDDDDFDERLADLELLKTVKRMLLDYITEIPSRKLKSGEFTWTEIKPYIYNMHYPRFKEYLQDHEIHASGKMVLRCLKDLHISRRDGWLKKRRKEREQRSKEEMDNLEVENTTSDGYITYRYKRNN